MTDSTHSLIPVTNARHRGIFFSRTVDMSEMYDYVEMTYLPFILNSPTRGGVIVKTWWKILE
ncbi:unnamed protein product [marine sediment metagenome]|uniref:Uncharacterized protein n=1 Tax=marine sediment metagenome TaxID=412755 RepID=X0Z5N5_9ZZZZ